jgi:hypothetical protein
MSDQFEAVRAMQLAGTVSFPAPYPEPGRITLREVAGENGKKSEDEFMLRVKHVQSKRVTISRSIWIEDIEALYFNDDNANHTDEDVKPVIDLRDKWFFPARFGVASIADVIAMLKPRQPQNARQKGAQSYHALVGTVFVKESASVLMEVIAGLTAGESAAYHPPAFFDGHAWICH